MTDRMKSFVMGLVQGLVSRAQFPNKEPVAYLYNGVGLPKLPEWDTGKYPNLLLDLWTTAYAVSEPFVVEEHFLGDKATPSVPFLRSKLKSDEYSGREYWAEWETVTESEQIRILSVGWSNHEILSTDGTVYAPKNDDPTPVYLPEVLFDGEVVTNDYGKAGLAFTDHYAVGDTMRVTINGISEVRTAKKGQAEGQEIIGNAGLHDGYDETLDDGGDWCVSKTMRGLNGMYEVWFYYRYPNSTFQLKIERIALAKE